LTMTRRYDHRQSSTGAPTHHGRIDESSRVAVVVECGLAALPSAATHVGVGCGGAPCAWLICGAAVTAQQRGGSPDPRGSSRRRQLVAAVHAHRRRAAARVRLCARAAPLRRHAREMRCEAWESRRWRCGGVDVCTVPPSGVLLACHLPCGGGGGRRKRAPRAASAADADAGLAAALLELLVLVAQALEHLLQFALLSTRMQSHASAR
jgi:hypothetical protein